MNGQRWVILLSVVMVAVFTMSVAVTGTAAAADDEWDDDLDTGNDYYSGQTLYFDTATGTDVVWNIYEVEDGEAGSRAAIVEANSTGEATIDTSALEDGTEYVVGPDRNSLVEVVDGVAQANGSADPTAKSFLLLDQGFSVDFDDDTVEKGDSTDVDITSQLRVNFNYDVEITSGNMSTGDLQTVFGGTETADGTEVDAEKLTSADFSDIDAGEYTFSFDVTDTTASEDVSIVVEGDSDGNVALPSSTDVDQGDVASIPVELDGTDTAYVTIGQVDADGFRAIVMVEDGNDDGEVTIKANTEILLNTSNEDRYWAVDDEDSVTFVGQNGTTTLDQPLPVGSNDARSYDMRAGSGWDATDAALTGDTDRAVLRVYEDSTDDGSTGSATIPLAVNVDRGGVASIPVELDGTDTGYLTIGSEDADGFRAIVKVEDGNDDAEVTIEANTYTLLNTTNDDRYWTADDADSVTFVGHDGITTFDGPLPVGSNDARSYDLRAGSGWNSSAAELTGGTDRSVLRVQERSTNGVSIWTTSSSETLDSLAAIQDARADGTLEQPQSIENRTAVVEIEASGLEGPIRAADGEATSDRFASLVADDVVEFGPKRADVTNPADDRIDLESDGARVVTDPDMGRFYVVLDPEARSLSGDSVFEFAVPEDSHLATGDAQTTFQTAPFSVTDRSRLAAGSGSLAVDNATVARGDVATVSIDVGNNDRVSVRLGSEYAGWERVVRVEDTDGDGQVTLRVNTFTAGADTLPDSGIEAIGADEVLTIQDQYGTFDGPLGAGSTGSYAYTVAVHEAYNVSGDRFVGEYGVGRLNVEPRTTTGMTVWTAPNDADIETADDVTNAISEDRLTESQFVAEGDYAVAELEATGIFGALEVQPGNTYAEKLISLDENVSSLNFSVVKPSATPIGSDSTVDLSANTAALTVIPNQDDGTLYVLMDTSTFDGVADGDQRIPTFTVTAGDTVDTLATSDEDDVTVEQAFEMQSPTVEFDQNDVSAAPGQTISGTSNLAPGTELTIAVESQSTPYTSSVETEFTATVQADGTWSGHVDFSDGSRGQSYTVSVIEPDVSAAYDAEIGRPMAAFGDVTTTADTVTVDGVNLSEGGFVVVKTGSATGSFAGVSGYLAAGHHSGVEIPVSGVSEGETVYAVAHTDANGNEQYDGDAAYTNADGSPVSERATAPAEFSWPSEPAPTDPDGDGLYEDVSGDGDLNFPDVNALFQNTTSDAVQTNVRYFDFDGDGAVSLQDVLALFEMV